MPTPSGLPKAGDLVRHKDGKTLRVVERVGNGRDYALVLETLDGSHVPVSLRRANQPTQMLLTGAYCWLNQSGQWELLAPGALDHERLVAQVHAANPDIPKARVEKIVRLVRALS